MQTKSRPSFGQVYMQTAYLHSARSTCRRLAVGCVITTWDHLRVLSVGYNGNAPGLDNDCDSDIPGACGCLHAEENAVISCAPGDEPKIVYCTHLPCVMCAKRMLKLGGVTKVVYSEDYRRREGIELLTRRGVQVMQMERSLPPIVEFKEPVVLLRSALMVDPKVSAASIKAAAEAVKAEKKPTLSAVFCGHANENPVVCDCPMHCYCKEHTCKSRRTG